MAEGNGTFWQRTFVGVTAGAFLALLAFFAWLATTIIDVQERVTRIEGSIASLLRTRDVEERKDNADIEQRINRLENEADR